MRKGIVCLLLISAMLQLTAQHQLVGSPPYSTYTYRYRISASEARQVYRTGFKRINNAYLYHFVDSFPTGMPAPPSPGHGNYLRLHAVGNQVNVSLDHQDDLNAKLVYNQEQLLVFLHTTSGTPVTDAKLKYRKRTIAYQPAQNGYLIKKPKRGTWLEIEHAGVYQRIYLARNGKPTGLPNRMLNSFPFRQINSFIAKQRNKTNYRYRNYFYWESRYEKQFQGYLIFNKPIYRPGDTLKLKAYLLSKQRRPVNRPLLLRITDQNFLLDSILATIRPSRSGVFTYSLVLSDSLDLTLDSRYMFTLEEEKSRKYDLNKYDGDLDENEYALQRKILIRGKVDVEEYELSLINFKARVTDKVHHRNAAQWLYLKATDENELPILDGRVIIHALHNRDDYSKFYHNEVFIPDTLWSISQPLEAYGETSIRIPDSLFPAANFGYSLSCQFLNSNNESEYQQLRLQFFHDPYRIQVEEQGDSLRIWALQGNSGIAQRATIFALNAQGDTVQQEIVQLPAVIKPSAFVHAYAVQTANGRLEYTLIKQGSISCSGMHSPDSIHIEVSNPNNFPFWYSIYAGRKKLASGYSTALSYNHPSVTQSNYTLIVNYIAGNSVRQLMERFVLNERQLSISSDQQSRAYPGETRQVTLTVTDARGKPVAAADLSAYAITSKFKNAAMPEVPSLGKVHSGLPLQPDYIGQQAEIKNLRFTLEWELWREKWGLDRNAYYQFLYTRSLYQTTIPSPDGNTELAPFVVRHGEVQPVHLLYIDEAPVYFSQTDEVKRYSFSVRAGWHSLRLRTHNLQLQLDSFWVEPGVKTILSIQGDSTLNKRIRSEKMPDTLTRNEFYTWSNSLMLVNRKWSDRFFYISQNGNHQLFTPPATYGIPSSTVLAGPFKHQPARLLVSDQFQQYFEPEGGYSFDISKGLIKQKQWKPFSAEWNRGLSQRNQEYGFADFALREKEIDSLWNVYLDRRSAEKELFYSATTRSSAENGSLQISLAKKLSKPGEFVKNIILFRYDDLDFIRVYKGALRNLGKLSPGYYRLLVLFNGNKYFLKDSLMLRSGGLCYFEADSLPVRDADEFSRNIASIIHERLPNYYYDTKNASSARILQTFNNRYLNEASFTRTITGKVLEANNEQLPVPGAVLSIKGTGYGVMADEKGNFSIRVPQWCTLLVSSIGFQTEEIAVTDSDYLVVRLTMAENSLQEVVVVGYGLERKRKAMTYSISSISSNQLQGKVAGVQLRGIPSVAVGTQPVILVDGKLFSGSFAQLDSTQFAKVELISGEQAVALTGSEDQVMLITTKAALSLEPEPQATNPLRRNFRDDAYWQPNLQTDINGQLKFTITYPDDITNWRNYYVVMSRKGYSGLATELVKAYQPLSARLSSPNFLVEGDTSLVIGKAMNYLGDSQQVKRSFQLNNDSAQTASLLLAPASVDSFSVSPAAGSDSVTIQYSIRRNDGYSDGEARTIPVFDAGVQETNGIFAVLDEDTTFNWTPDTANSQIQLYVSANVLPVVETELESIRMYRYLCNEQLASKLKAALLKKKLYQSTGRKFEEEANIRDLIRRLQKNKNGPGLWGWWNDSQPLLWISLHVGESLLLAAEQGYAIDLNKDLLVQYHLANFNAYSPGDRITALGQLQQMGAKIDYRQFLDSLSHNKIAYTNSQQLKLLLIRQRNREKINTDSILATAQKTLMGNLYWGEHGFDLLDNSITNSLLVYQILKQAGGYQQALTRIRNFFLEKRGRNGWNNTYESISILEAILPDLEQEMKEKGKSRLVINDSLATDHFPISLHLPSGKPLKVEKSGAGTLYFTAYQKRWNANPSARSGDFALKSRFLRNDREVTSLKGGEAVELEVEITVKADGEYVMVEIPIPAGCSYASKPQPRSNYEIHREYDKEKLSLFCSRLPRGVYRYRIPLMPRYTGSYQLNPARVELMYYPLFMAREGMKRIRIL